MPNACRDKGNKTERDVAGYLRLAGIPTAERRVVTGWRRTDRSDPDLGDIKGCPGLCIQVKNLDKTARGNLSGKALADVMAELETQREASGAALGVLIEKRPHNANVGTWWAHLPANTFCGLAFGIDPYAGMWADYTPPVRIELRYIVDYLVRFSAMCKGTEAV